jgi:probable F420-dependent oxidoreductase
MSRRLLGCKIPSAGETPMRLDVAKMASAAEEAGADSLWVPDHVVLVEEGTSRYPYATGGQFLRDAREDYYHALVYLAWMAAATTRVELGTAIFILPQRNPVEVAKILATIDVLSRGRVVFGVGAGWSAEEFAVLGADFPSRFERLTEAIEVIRHCWSGSGEALRTKHYEIPQGVFSRPVPARPGGIPILVGGMKTGPRRRAAAHGDGWLAIGSSDSCDLPALSESIQSIHEDLTAVGRPAEQFRMTMRLQVAKQDSAEKVAYELAPALFDIGFNEVIIDPAWQSIDSAQNLIAGAVSACGIKH